MSTETEKKNRDKLFHLMKENPDLPVVPMVDADICGDDSGYWSGMWGKAAVDEYLICTMFNYIVFKSDDDIFDTLEKYLTAEEFEKLPESEEDCREFYDNLPWTKAIIVYITTL